MNLAEKLFPMSEVEANDRGTGQGSAEQRQHVRLACKLRAARTGEQIETFKPAPLVRVVNISQGGIALHLREPFEVGNFLTVRLYDSLGQPVSPDMEIRVAHASQQANGTWVLGAAFTTQLSETEVQRYLS
jgi:hypothetical protein